MSLLEYKGIGLNSSETLLMLDQEGFIEWKHKIFLKYNVYKINGENYNCALHRSILQMR